MDWRESWESLFGEAPTDPTSREVSVQDVLATLIAGRKPVWFEAYGPTEGGRRFLEGLWAMGFGSGPGNAIEWFVSEYELPVPLEWREEIGLTYGCPDLACGVGDRVLIVELKTERGSYRARQMSDYLRLARHKHPDCWTDVALLGPHAPGAEPVHDDRQRYAELTWRDIASLLGTSFDGDRQAARLAEFLSVELARPLMGEPPFPSEKRPAVSVAEVQLQEVEVSVQDKVEASVSHALRMAPSVASAKASDKTERGIDVEFSSDDEARTAQRAVKQALEENGYADTVSVWLWRPSSSGTPLTEAGKATDRELRLAPKLAPSD
jgi:hypothetical protein